MKPLSAAELRGNWATLLLAWNDDSLDVGRVAHELDVLIALGVDGIYAHGTAGDFHTTPTWPACIRARLNAGATR